MLSNSECNAATPLVLCEPTMARCAMRILGNRTVFDQTDALDPPGIAGIAGIDVVKKPAIDFVDDFEMARQ